MKQSEELKTFALKNQELEHIIQVQDMQISHQKEQLQQLQEAILGKALDKRNFRKKINSLGYLKPLEEYQKGVSYRAAKLYKLDRRKFLKVIG